MNDLGRILAVSAVAALLTIWVPGAVAVEVPTLFTAEVLLDEAADNPREEAYRKALIEVLARVSGSAIGADEAIVDELFPLPSAYVTQFRPGDEETLFVSFDGEALEKVLRGAGFRVWGSDRPLTLIWLAVDWGEGRREIIAAESPDEIERQSRTIDRNRLLRERLLEIAQQRGVPILFPLLDTTDLQGVTFSDIWGGFDERILAASGRYEVDSVLIGRVRPSSARGNRWTYRFGNEQRSWTGTPESVVAQVADMLAAEFAVGGSDLLERLVLRVSGIQSVEAYGEVQTLLDDTPIIEAFRINGVSGDTISYDVEVRGGAGRLRRALGFSGLTEQEMSLQVDGSRADLEFYYEP